MPDVIAKPVKTAIQVAVILITITAWWITWSEARNMGILMRLGVPMSLGMAGWADPTSFAVFTGMWAVMMVAMMLPSSYPTLVMHRSLYQKRHSGQTGGTFLFALGYFAVWTLTGVLFYAAYILMGYWRSAVPGSDVSVLRIAGVSLVAAGVYQWIRLKFTCLKHCKSPLFFLMEHWRDGRTGAIRTGAEHGFYCFGCCWGLMVVLFTMGVMHLGWMAAVGVLILLEKLTPSSTWLPKLTGALIIAMGVVVFAIPSFLAGLSSQVVLRH